MNNIEGTEFDKNKTVFALNFLHDFNQKLFNNSLPIFKIIWSTRMTSCAGKIIYDERTIKLSSKLIIDTMRLKEVLIHELCHAAVYFIDKSNEKHGKLFKKWGQHCTSKCGIGVSTCHKYLMRAWKCSNCGLIILTNNCLKSYYHKLCGCYHFIEIPYNDYTKGLNLNKKIVNEHLIKIKDDIEISELKLPKTPEFHIPINSLPSPPVLPCLDKKLFPEFLKW